LETRGRAHVFIAVRCIAAIRAAGTAYEIIIIIMISSPVQISTRYPDIHPKTPIQWIGLDWTGQKIPSIENSGLTSWQFDAIFSLPRINFLKRGIF